MAKITRYNGNLLAPASAALGTERTIFGEVTQSDDLTDQFTADLLRGWGIVGPSDEPTLQDFNAMGFTLGQLHAYLHQVGVPEYNAAQEYYEGSFTNSGGILYVSIVDNNVGNTPASSPVQWEAYGQGVDFLNTTRIDVASASTVNLTSAAPDTRHINITGTTTINGFTVAAGQCYFVRFNAALTLANGASLVTNRGANITVASGDSCIIRATAADTVEIICGEFLIDRAIGSGQTWQVFTSPTRITGTTYTNSTGRSIVLAFTGADGSNTASLEVNGVQVAFSGVPAGTFSEVPFVTAIIPNGATYRIVGTTFIWAELRA